MRGDTRQIKKMYLGKDAKIKNNHGEKTKVRIL